MLEGMQPEQKQTPCGVRKLCHSLNAADKEILIDALKNEVMWSTSDLEKALKDRGAKISYPVLRRHRREECSCRVGWQDA